MSPRPPGLLRPDVQPDVLMMICTAGHVDHGKTQLVKLLTGCSTDRLKEEQERGLTIELGFAPCFLGGNTCIGIVDVPGHEKFVRTMVAGVSGIAMTVFVIAADDGIMPQTVEHFQIMALLGVRRGIVALTKIDLVTPAQVEQRVEEIREFTAGTFLDGAPICPVSSETFDGYPEFYDTIIACTRSLGECARSGAFRMPIERVFRQQGFGAVVTGIPIAGSIAVGDRVEVMPGGLEGRVRGIQRFLRDATEGGAGQCLALNIPDIGKSAPQRGQVVALPGTLRPARFFHARLKPVPGLPKPLRNAEEIKFHAGTAEAPGKLYLLDDGGEASALATVALSAPVAAAIGDRFILRRASPVATIAGGEILDITYSQTRPRKRILVEQLSERERFFKDVAPVGAERVAATVEYALRAARAGADVRDLASRTMLTPVELRPLLDELVQHDKAVMPTPDYYVHREVYETCVRDARARLDKATEGGALSVTPGEIFKAADWPAALCARVQEELVGSGAAVLDGNRLILPAGADDLSPDERAILARIVDTYEQTGFQSPRPAELPELLGAPAQVVARTVELLCNRHQLVRLSASVVLARTHFRKAQDIVVRTIQEEGVLDSADFKLRIGSTRKYALAILDFLDARHVTLRVGNNRRLSASYEKHLLS